MKRLIKDGTKSYFNPFKPKSIILLIMDASSCAASLWGRGWCFWSKQVSICCFEVKTNKKEEAFMLGCLNLLSSLLEKWHNTKKENKKKNYRKNNTFLETKRCVTPCIFARCLLKQSLQRQWNPPPLFTYLSWAYLWWQKSCTKVQIHK